MSNGESRFKDEQLRRSEAKLEADGEEKVRQDLRDGVYGAITDFDSKATWVQNWLNKKENEKRVAKREGELAEVEGLSRTVKGMKDAVLWLMTLFIVGLSIFFIVILIRVVFKK